MSFLSSLLRSLLPLGALALLGAASCTSILGDDFELDGDEGGDGSGDDGSGSGSSAGGVCPPDEGDLCGECVCDVCPDDMNACSEDALCAACLDGDDVACESSDPELIGAVFGCAFDACSFECDAGGT